MMLHCAMRFAAVAVCAAGTAGVVVDDAATVCDVLGVVWLRRFWLAPLPMLWPARVLMRLRVGVADVEGVVLRMVVIVRVVVDGGSCCCCCCWCLGWWLW